MNAAKASSGRPGGEKATPFRFPRRTFLLSVVAAIVVLVVVAWGVFPHLGSNGSSGAAVSRLTLEDIPFDGAKAYEYLQQVCAIGPRPSGSRGMDAQQKLLTDHFSNLGAQVHLQRFRAQDPRDGSWVAMANLIVQWHPQSRQRILLCTHYDTLPFPLLDRKDPKGVFLGANDGGSGVAVLMQMGHEMRRLESNYGVDFVFFDAEEYIFQPQDTYFLGSTYFARQYVENPSPHRYRWGVLLDMVGDADLQLYQERNSMGWGDTRPLVEQIWGVARRLGVREFIPRKKFEISDDHLPLHNIGGIPTCDIIDFDYPFWHTQQDTADRCSALSLAKVGWVIREWLRSVR